jgi:heptosyltransferase-2
VGVFGPTSAQWVRLPDRPRKEVTRGLACQPCFVYSPRHLRCQYGDYRCLTELPVDDVLAAALSVIDGQAASRRA